MNTNGSMSNERLTSAIDAPEETHRERHVAKFNTRVREYVTWVGLIGTGLNAAFFFLVLMYEAVKGSSLPTNWLTRIMMIHYAAVVGVPLSAVTAFCIVCLLKVTNVDIEFDAPGFKFHGASGPIVLWILCFLSVVGAFHFVWLDLAVPIK